MTKKIIIITLCLLFVTGCGEKIPTLKNGEEAVVTFEDGSKISVEDLYNKLKETAAMNTLVEMVDTKLLEEKYKNFVEEAKQIATDNVNSVVASYGSEDAAIEALKTYMGMTSLEEYYNYVYLYELQEHQIMDYAKDQIKEKDIKNYYKNDVVGDIKVSHILITPDVTEGMSDAEKKEAEDKAKAQIEDIIKSLNAVKKSEIAKKFAELAAEYSDDEGTAKEGGNMGYVNKATLSTEYSEFSTAAYKLADGEYTTKVVTSSYGYHVILRVESKSKASLDSVRDSILETLATNLIKDDATITIEALRSLRKEYGMEIIDTDIQKQYSTYIQNQLYAAQNPRTQ